MTLGQITVGFTVLLVAACLGGFLATGNLTVGMGLLAAPIPGLLVFGLYGEWADWTVGELRQRRHSNDPIEAALNASLRPAVEPVPVENDETLFVPGVPTMPPRSDCPA